MSYRLMLQKCFKEFYQYLVILIYLSTGIFKFPDEMMRNLNSHFVITT